jgi:hypothetical protein
VDVSVTSKCPSASQGKKRVEEVKGFATRVLTNPKEKFQGCSEQRAPSVCGGQAESVTLEGTWWGGLGVGSGDDLGWRAHAGLPLASRQTRRMAPQPTEMDNLARLRDSPASQSHPSLPWDM